MVRARTTIQEVLRLAGLLACLALATSRIGLLAHELVGHGGTAVALGARVTDVQLFWFAGGWIRYHLAEPSLAAALAISMGGIAVELVCGLALMLAVRPRRSGGAVAEDRRIHDTLSRRLVRGIGAALVLHGSWYLATGAWHGYGDGVLLHQELGSAGYAVAIAAGLVTCAAGYAGARGVVGALLHTLSSHRVVGLVIAVVLAGGLHVALAVGEVRLRRDPTYVEIMRPEKDKLVERDLARWAEYQRTHGGDISQEAERTEQKRLERVHRTFPFAWLLGIAAALAVLAGALRTRPGSEAQVSRRLLVIAATSAVISIGVVIAIDLLTR